MSDQKPIVDNALRKTAVIIPAQNEESSIGLVLDDLPEVGCVIVVDNGSTDNTAAIAESKGCLVVKEPIAGYGRACLTGMNHLKSLVDSQQIHTDYVCFVDGDYSDHPQELTKMLAVLIGQQGDQLTNTLSEQQSDVEPIAGDEPLADNESYDFVLGSRMLGPREAGAMLPQAMMGNWLACTLMRLFWGAKFTDLGPFRLIRYDKLMSLGMQDLNFGWTIEMQIKATLAKLRTVEIPTPYRRRVGVSKISGTISGTIRAGYKILYTIARFAYLSKFRRSRFMSNSLPSAATVLASASSPSQNIA